jgi:hypothetical protein
VEISGRAKVRGWVADTLDRRTRESNNDEFYTKHRGQLTQFLERVATSQSPVAVARGFPLEELPAQGKISSIPT